ncbi:DeoR family transcriptional regulator [Enterococcus sp. JM4C]|uniref:DeoR/GlpR family DNA-binding transcription regulator n=1 Tax=Candidatus Enterococcus huntleyi TaxID=1857217 RepID=UPI001379DFBB|nr:DeoR/GlpR family DNA-binding transcription regulator [Enterococcus sp. JM4C]KAF1298627.1 DeoR family transcriptional regulator [Enterococcus sp. JM4C]
MLTDERKQRILQLVEQHSIVKSQDLMNDLNVSESTIRRDLQELEDEGLIERIHGGAKKSQKLSYEQAMSEKTFKNIHEKRKIAALAAEEIVEGDIIYLDAGSTTLEMIAFLNDRSITVVTNSVQHAAKLVERQIPTIILGGAIKLSTDAVLGSTSLQQLSQLRFNKVFMGMNAAHLEFGYSTPDPEEAALKKLAMKQAEESFVLIDQTKFNQVTFSKVASIEEATIITDACDELNRTNFQQITTIKEAL